MKWNCAMMMVGGRIAVLGLVFIGLGVPLTSLFNLLILLIASVLVAAGRVRRIRMLWIAALACCGLILFLKSVLPLPRIEEGHNVFIERPCCSSGSETAGEQEPGPDATVFARGLPKEVYRSLRDAFRMRFPNGVTPEPDTQVFAFSADSLLVRPRARWSRVVRSIDFTDRWELRIGAMNTMRYNVWTKDHGITRDTLPYFVTYAIPRELRWGSLCWRGEMFWPTADGTLEAVVNEQRACRPLEGKGPWQVWGIEVSPDRPLAMALEPPLSIRILRVGHRLLELLGAVLPLVLLVRVRRRQLWVPGATVLSFFIGAVLAYPHVASGFILFEGGNDGLTYMDYARQSLEALYRHDWWEAFRGGEDVFYYMPGQRYVFAVLSVLSGDTIFAWLGLGCLLPLTLYALMRRLLSTFWSSVLMGLFLTVPLLESFGFWHYYYARLLVRGFTEPFGYSMAFLALALLLPRLVAKGQNALPAAGTEGAGGDGDGDGAGSEVQSVPLYPEATEIPATIGALVAGGFCLALAVFSRPNLVPGAAALLLGLSVPWMRARNWRPLLALAAGFSPVLLIPLHNILYGGVLVLLTRSAGIDANLQASPLDYFWAIRDVFSWELATPSVAKIAEKLRHWVAPYEVWRMAVLAVVLWAATLSRETALRLLAWVALAQHGVLLFYMSTGRYGYFAWTVSLLIALTFVIRLIPWKRA